MQSSVARHEFSGGGVSLALPYPPSVNRYWRAAGGRRSRVLVSREGRRYRVAVWIATRDLVQSRRVPLIGELAVVVVMRPKDLRRRDVDNVAKALLDALTHAGVYSDDSQIRRLTIDRGDVDRREPRVEVRIDPYAAS